MGYENPFYRFPGDENGVRRERKLDVEAIIGADISLKDNTVLERSLFPCTRSFGPQRSFRFLRQMMSYRLDTLGANFLSRIIPRSQVKF